MPETQTTAVAVRTEPRAWLSAVQAVTDGLGRAGAWTVATAEEIGAFLAVLSAPAVFSAYAFASWSLAANLGWTDTFVFEAGPLSNWFVWLVFAIAIHLLANILKRHTAAAKISSRG